MKIYLPLLGGLALCYTSLLSALPPEPSNSLDWSEKKPLTEEEKKQTRLKLEDQILELADRQDELSADIQELIEGQTNEEVIKALEEVEVLMVEVIDNLEEDNTGGETIAIETEIIERIFQSAKKKQQQESSGQGKKDKKEQSMDAMLEMMKQMMGKGKDGETKKAKPGDKEKGGQKAGQGQTGDSDITAENFAGSNSEGNKERRVPSSGGTTKDSLPKEFHKAMDAYNKRAEERALQRR